MLAQLPNFNALPLADLQLVAKSLDQVPKGRARSKSETVSLTAELIPRDAAWRSRGLLLLAASPAGSRRPLVFK